PATTTTQPNGWRSSSLAAISLAEVALLEPITAQDFDDVLLRLLAGERGQGLRGRRLPAAAASAPPRRRRRLGSRGLAGRGHDRRLADQLVGDRPLGVDRL